MTRLASLAARLAAAVLVTAGAGLAGVATAAPATAATCGSGTGVSVVVDFGGLGRGVQSECVPGGAGKSASSLFAAFHDLSFVQNEPGFVCRIDDLPSPSDEACVNTPPDDAYWGLWWSDGTSGDWVYSNYGVSSLKVPDGAYIGFAWQTGTKSPPGAPATPHTSSPTPSATPTPSSPSTGGGGHGTGNGGGQAGNGGASGGGHGSMSASARPTPSTTSPPVSGTPTTSLSGSPSASPTEAGGDGKPRTPSATPTPSIVPAGTPSSVLTSPATDSAEPEARSEVAAGDDSALPVWVVPLVILVLGASASAVYVKRRRHRPSP